MLSIYSLSGLCASIVVLMSIVSVQGISDMPPRARPTPDQARWQDAEIGMFIHLAPNTWSGKEYDDLSVPLSEINPTELDTDQWVRVAQSLGAKYIVFVAKHAGGFCMWQTDTTGYSVKNTPWRGGHGDVLADLAASCRKAQMPLGVYLSPTDARHHAGGGGVTADPAQQTSYDKVYREQLTEVLGRYGHMFEVWFDGSTHIPIGDVLKRYAPHAAIFQSQFATIRWVGNEEGIAPYPAWNATTREALQRGATAADGDPDGEVWLPNECDVSLPSTWFWNPHSDGTIKSVPELMHIYESSVGHGANLLINAPPDTTGRIPEAEASRLAEFGAEIRRQYGHPLASAHGEGAVVEIRLTAPEEIDRSIVQEQIRDGERVRSYEIDGRQGGAWKTLCTGSAIGHEKIDHFAPTRVDAVRLRILESAGKPEIRSFEVFEALPPGR